jgi:uncharacterized protein (TIGR00251 family)
VPGADGWSISVWVQPGARASAPQGIVDGCLKLRLAAPAVEGRANEALVRWIAQRLDVPLRAVTLVAGQTGRRKRLRVECALGAEAIEARLLAQR